MHARQTFVQNAALSIAWPAILFVPVPRNCITRRLRFRGLGQVQYTQRDATTLRVVAHGHARAWPLYALPLTPTSFASPFINCRGSLKNSTIPFLTSETLCPLLVNLPCRRSWPLLSGKYFIGRLKKAACLRRLIGHLHATIAVIFHLFCFPFSEKI